MDSLKKTTRRRSEPITAPTGPAAGDAYGPVIGEFPPEIDVLKSRVKRF
jgi:hypothetical protein